MPLIKVIRDIDKDDHHPRPDLDKVIHVRDAVITIGTLAGGMESGKTSIILEIPLPDGRVVVAESSLECAKGAFAFLAAIPY